MHMDFSLELIMYALEKNMENEIFEMWKLQFPQMTEENFISFYDYKNSMLTKKHTKISYEEIELEMLRVEKAFEERG